MAGPDEATVGDVKYYSYCLVKAMEAVYKNQGVEYGHPADNFGDTAAIWSVILGIKVEPKQVGLCMIGAKMAREKANHNPDNFTDIAGYAEATMRALVEKRPQELDVGKLGMEIITPSILPMPQ